METTPALEPSPRPSLPWWAVADLVAFGTFCLFTWAFLPAALVLIAGVFIPSLAFANLSAEAQILLQAALDLAWVGFLFYLVKVVHRKPIMETFRWHRTHQYGVVTLIAIGLILAIAVLAVSSFFPPSSPPAIEKLAESSRSLYMLVIFSVFFAPLVEEIIFRGFIFNALSELGGHWLAMPATAVLFALLHAPQLWPSFAGVVLIFVVGCVLSMVRQRSNSLIPSFIVHTAYNGMLVGASAIASLLEKGK